MTSKFNGHGQPPLTPLITDTVSNNSVLSNTNILSSSSGNHFNLTPSSNQSPHPGFHKEYHSDAVNLQLQSAASAAMDEMVPTNLSRVLIIYTGGTIGMQHTRDMGYAPVPHFLTQTLASQTRFHDPTDSVSRDPDGAAAIPGAPVPPLQRLYNKIIKTQGEPPVRADALITPISLWGKRIVYSILEYDPLLDSSNMSMQDWVKIASDIELNYELYDAFIILHGTDTMSYTASALSFVLENLGKTVILTGSQVPLAEVRNDAIENLLGALTIAGHFVIPEVTLYFHNKLFRGNRSSKVDAVDFAAFDSPNLAPLVSVGINIDVHWRDIWRPRDLAKFRAHKILDANVATLRLFPGITISTIKAFLQPPIRGVVLETYGAGNGPDSREDVLAAFKEAHDRGVVIVNCTQCRRGLVTDLYSTGKALVEAGAVPGADMTTEAALTKLSYLLGKELNPHAIRHLIRRSLRGELTAVDPRPRFALSRHDFAAILHQVLGHVSNDLDNDQEPIWNTASDSDEQDEDRPDGEYVGALKSVPLMGFNDRFVHLPPSPSNCVPISPSSFPGPKSPSSLIKLSSQQTPSTDMGAAPTSTAHQVERTLTPILMSLAASQGDVRHLKYLRRECPHISLNLGDPLSGATPLHYAAAHTQPSILQYLLAHGANVHARDRTGHSPLWYALMAAHNHSVPDALSAEGENDRSVPTILDSNLLPGNSNDCEQVINMLVRTGAHLSSQEIVRAGYEALWAAMRGETFHVALWFRAGVPVNATVGPERRPLLHAAVDHLHVPMTRFLITRYLKSGVSLTVEDINGRTPLEIVQHRLKRSPHLSEDKRMRALDIVNLLECAINGDGDDINKHNENFGLT